MVNSDNQKAGGSNEEFAGDGGGSLTGLAPVTVANANSRIANPEQSDFFIIFLPSLESCRAVADLNQARI
jgi:hypothetical protein